MTDQHDSTRSVHAGEEKEKPYGSLTTPIIQSATFAFRDTAEIIAFMEAKQAGETLTHGEYGRYSNPTQAAAEHKLAALEGGERALLFSSGMAAISTTLLTLVSSGKHVIMANQGYYHTREFAVTLLKKLGIETTFIAIDQPAAFAAAIKPNTSLVFFETPSNPYLRVADLAQMADLARENHITSVVDSTFATPLNLHPLEFGIDLVIHSATKYLAGHNDLLAGALIGPAQALGEIATARTIMGSVSSPNDAYLLIRGMKTLDLRVRRHNENGLRVAQFLEGKPGIRQVYYPGLESHPDHQIAVKQMKGFGGVVSFEIDGDFEKTGRFLDLLHIPYNGPSLGGVESIAQQPAALYSLDPIERKLGGMQDNLVRFSTGIEDADDLIADLGQALAKL